MKYPKNKQAALLPVAVVQWIQTCKRC